MNGIATQPINVINNCAIRRAFFFDFTSHPIELTKNNIEFELNSSTFVQNYNHGNGGSIYINGQDSKIIFYNVGASYCRIYFAPEDPNGFSEGNFAFLSNSKGLIFYCEQTSVTLCSYNKDIENCRGSFHCAITEGSVKDVNTSNCYADRHACMYIQGNQNDQTKTIELNNIITVDHYAEYTAFAVSYGSFSIDNLVVANVKGSECFTLNIKKITISHSYFYDNENPVLVSASCEEVIFSECFIEKYTFSASNIQTINMLSTNNKVVNAENNVMKMSREALLNKCSYKKRNNLVMMALVMPSSIE